MINAKIREEITDYNSITNGMYFCKTYNGSKALLMKEGSKFSLIFNDGSFCVRDYDQYYWEVLNFVELTKIKQDDEINLKVDCNP